MSEQRVKLVCGLTLFESSALPRGRLFMLGQMWASMISMALLLRRYVGSDIGAVSVRRLFEVTLARHSQPFLRH